MPAFLDPTLAPTPRPNQQFGPRQSTPRPGGVGAGIADTLTGIPAPTQPPPAPRPNQQFDPRPSTPRPGGPSPETAATLAGTATQPTPDPLAGPGPDPLAGPGPTPTPGWIDPNQALQQVSTAFTNKFGRPMTPEEQQALAQAVNFTGGQVTQAQLDQALALVAEYSGDLTNPGGTPAPTPGPTATPGPQGIDPNEAAQTAGTAFFQRFGRQPTQAEFQFLADAAGWTGGPVTQEQLDAALDAITRYTGDIENPFEVTNPTLEAALTALQPILEIPFGEVDPNNPAIRGQREVFERQTQRSAERRRAQAAEIAAQEGTLGAGGFDIATDQILAEQGQENAAFEANLIAAELTQQRAALMQGIEIATQAGLTQQAQELQEQLGTLDIQLREFLGRGQLGLGLLGLTLEDQQFLESLGFNYAQLQNLMNSQAIDAILG